MRILVCGSRDAKDSDYPGVKAVLNVIVRYGDWIIEGGADGVDHFASVYAGTRADEEIIHQQFRADWKKYGTKAGPMRNKQMIVEGKPDLVVAFKGGKGTANMITLARKAKIPLLLADDQNMKLPDDEEVIPF